MSITLSLQWLWAVPFIIGLLLLWRGNIEQKNRRRYAGTFSYFGDMIPTGSGVMGCLVIFSTLLILFGVLISRWVG